MTPSLTTDPAPGAAAGYATGAVAATGVVSTLGVSRLIGYEAGTV